MEQINYLKQKLTIGYFTPIKIKHLPALDSYYIILFVSSMCLLLSIFFHSNFSVYIGIGFGLPIFFLGKDVTLRMKHYWLWFCVLLVLRNLTTFGLALDAVLIVSLWHPNIKLAQNLSQRFQLNIQHKQ